MGFVCEMWYPPKGHLLFNGLYEWTVVPPKGASSHFQWVLWVKWCIPQRGSVLICGGLCEWNVISPKGPLAFSSGLCERTVVSPRETSSHFWWVIWVKCGIPRGAYSFSGGLCEWTVVSFELLASAKSVH